MVWPVFGTRNQLKVYLALAQSLETVRVREHISSLLAQRGKPSRDLVVNTHSNHLPSFLSGWNAAQGRHSDGDPVGILDLACSVELCQAKERFDGISAYGKPCFIKSKTSGSIKLLLEIGSKLTA